jgi:hypothetical protein
MKKQIYLNIIFIIILLLINFSYCNAVQTISVSSLWMWNSALVWSSLDTAQKFLNVTVIKLMVVIWATSLLIMTIGGGYMIFAHWKDELLNKWKSIFNAGLIWLVVALSAVLIMKLVIYILYS